MKTKILKGLYVGSSTLIILFVLCSLMYLVGSEGRLGFIDYLIGFFNFLVDVLVFTGTVFISAILLYTGFSLGYKKLFSNEKNS